MRAQASVVHSDKAFLAPGQIIDFVHLWMLYCWIAFLHLSGPWGVGCLMVSWLTHFKSVCMFAQASVYIFTCSGSMGIHFCSVWSSSTSLVLSIGHSQKCLCAKSRMIIFYLNNFVSLFSFFESVMYIRLFVFVTFFWYFFLTFITLFYKFTYFTWSL